MTYERLESGSKSSKGLSFQLTPLGTWPGGPGLDTHLFALASYHYYPRRKRSQFIFKENLTL